VFLELSIWRGKGKNRIAIEEDCNGEEEDVAEEVEKLHVGLCAGVETTLSGSSLESEVGSKRNARYGGS